jgi:hypothetical protein
MNKFNDSLFPTLVCQGRYEQRVLKQEEEGQRKRTKMDCHLYRDTEKDDVIWVWQCCLHNPSYLGGIGRRITI